MNNYSFADVYRSAQFTVEPASMALRQKAAERFQSTAKSSDYLAIIRTYFGLEPSSTDQEKFVELFRSEDATFSIVDGSRELTILCTGLLASAINSGNLHVALALVTASCAGVRVAHTCPELPNLAKKLLYDSAVEQRAKEPAIRVAPAGKQDSTFAAQIDAWTAQGSDVNKFASLLKSVCQELDQRTTSSADQSSRHAAALMQEIAELREELEMLWWTIGEHSTYLEQPYIALPKPLVPMLIGIELARMTKSGIAPAAIPALMQIQMKACSLATSLTIAESIEALVGATAVEVPSLEERLTDICPLLAGVQFRSTSGEPNVWHPALKHKTGIEAAVALPPIDLAMQVYRECLLARTKA